MRANCSDGCAASTRVASRIERHGRYPDIIEFLALMVERGGSDLHLCAGSQPMIRLHGDLIPASDKVMDAETCRELIFSVFTENQRARFEETWELDFALMVNGLGRFRCQCSLQPRFVSRRPSAIFPMRFPSIDDLVLPPDREEALHAGAGIGPGDGNHRLWEKRQRWLRWWRRSIREPLRV